MDLLAHILAFNGELMMREQLYRRAVGWIVSERAGSGRWLRNPQAVAGWMVVRMTAAVYGRPVKEVVADLFEAYEHEKAAKSPKRETTAA